MLDVVILVGDPIIALDLADAAQSVDGAARVRMLDRADARVPERATHAFLGPGMGDAALCRRLVRHGAGVFLVGADEVPAPLRGVPGVIAVPYTFTAAQITALLETRPGPDRPTAA